MNTGNPHLDLIAQLKQIPAVNAFSPQDFASLYAAVQPELEMRVGEKLTALLTEAQIDEFEGLMDQETPAQASSKDSLTAVWLAAAIPDYPNIVRATVQEILAELAKAFA